MATFADAFAQAYNAGLQRRWQDEREERLRREQEAEKTKAGNDLRSLIGLTGGLEQQAKNTQISNDLYNSTQNFQKLTGLSPTGSQSQLMDALNPVFKSSIDTSQPDYNNMSGILSGTYKEPQQSSLASLFPTELKQGPSWDNASMYNTVSQATQSGVDPSRAMPFIQNFYAGKQSQQKETLQNERISSLTNMLPKAKTLQQATAIATELNRYGVKVDSSLLKEVFKNPEYSIQTIDYGDRKKIIAVNNNDPNDVRDLESGEVGMTPYQRESLDTTRRGQDLTYAAARERAAATRTRGGGGSGDGSGMTTAEKREYDAAVRAITMHDQWMRDNTDKYSGIAPNPTTSPYYGEVQHAQRIVQKYIRRDMGYQPQSVQIDPEDPRVKAAKAAGYSDEEIAQFLQGGQQPQPAPQPVQQRQPVTANFMGETVTGAVPGYNVQLPNVQPPQWMNEQYVPPEENKVINAWKDMFTRR